MKASDMVRLLNQFISIEGDLEVYVHRTPEDAMIPVAGLGIADTNEQDSIVFIADERAYNYIKENKDHEIKITRKDN